MRQGRLAHADNADCNDNAHGVDARDDEAHDGGARNGDRIGLPANYGMLMHNR